MRLPLLTLTGLGLLAATACNTSQEANAGDTAITADTTATAEAADMPYKISLAQWSLNRRYRAEGGKPYEFAADAKALGFEGIEYVSALYMKDFAKPDAPQAEHDAAVKRVFARLDSIATAEGMTEVLIMIDAEGETGDADEAKRMRAVTNHKAFIDAAAASGIPTIRLNAGGQGSKQEVSARVIKSLSELGAYAKTKNVNVVVENHGSYSSDPVWLRDIMASINMDNVGILPDFGNFCRRHVDNDWQKGCASEVPLDSTYTAVGMWMPYAHAVSAKAYNFGPDGMETKIDYARMMDTVVAHGYTGFVGIEFEGEGEEVPGIQATKALLERVGSR